jgi:hypothetical protein
MNAYSKVIEFLKNKTDIERPIELISAIERVCLQYKDISAYIGKIFKKNQNRKLRDLCTKLLEDRHIVRVGEHPTRVYWKSDPQILGDISDLGDSQITPPTSEIGLQSDGYSDEKQYSTMWKLSTSKKQYGVSKYHVTNVTNVTKGPRDGYK